MPFDVPHSPMFPLSYAGDDAVLVASAALTAAGAWTHSSVVEVRGAALMHVSVYYTADATGGAGGFPLVIPRWSNKAGTTAPTAIEDVWKSFIKPNDTRTLTTPSVAFPTGDDETGAPGFAYMVSERIALRTVAMANDTDAVRHGFTLNVRGLKWICFRYAEVGDTSNPGTFALDYALAV